jgi:hypothetical protein
MAGEAMRISWLRARRVLVPQPEALPKVVLTSHVEIISDGPTLGGWCCVRGSCIACHEGKAMAERHICVDPICAANVIGSLGEIPTPQMQHHCEKRTNMHGRGFNGENGDPLYSSVILPRAAKWIVVGCHIRHIRLHGP